MSFETKSGKECDLCGGEGITYWVADDHSEPCPECHGLGWIPASGDELKAKEADAFVGDARLESRLKINGRWLLHSYLKTPGELSELLDFRLAPAPQEEAKIEGVYPAIMGWHNGYPPHPFNKEWFIAVTKHGGRVVLRALPEEYSYDFKTADETYFKKENIVKWMQFPDSSFIPYEETARPLTCGGGFDGPHHTADWMANDGPGVKEEVKSLKAQLRQALYVIEIAKGIKPYASMHTRNWYAKFEEEVAQLDALRNERNK